MPPGYLLFLSLGWIKGKGSGAQVALGVFLG